MSARHRFLNTPKTAVTVACLLLLAQTPANAVVLEYGAAVDISFATGSKSETTGLANDTVSVASPLAQAQPNGAQGTWAQATTGNSAPGAGMTLKANADGGEGPSQAAAAAGQIYKNTTGAAQAFTWDVELSGSAAGSAELNAIAVLAVFTDQPVFNSAILLDGIDLGDFAAVLSVPTSVDFGFLTILPTASSSLFCTAGASNPSCSFGFSVQDRGSAWLLTGLLATAAAGQGNMASSINSLHSTLIPVPEPTSLALMALGVLGAAATRRRKH